MRAKCSAWAKCLESAGRLRSSPTLHISCRIGRKSRPRSQTAPARAASPRNTGNHALSLTKRFGAHDMTETSLIDRSGLDRTQVNKLINRGLEGADDGELFLEY